MVGCVLLSGALQSFGAGKALPECRLFDDNPQLKGIPQVSWFPHATHFSLDASIPGLKSLRLHNTNDANPRIRSSHSLRLSKPTPAPSRGQEAMLGAQLSTPRPSSTPASQPASSCQSRRLWVSCSSCIHPNTCPAHATAMSPMLRWPHTGT